MSIRIKANLYFVAKDKNGVELIDQAAPQTLRDDLETTSLFGSYKETRPQSASPSKVLEELEEYLKEPRLAIGKPESLPLTFWKRSVDRFKFLASISLDVFCVPASSANIERVFSVARDILSAKRTRMKSILFRRILFIRRNYFLLNS